MAHLKQFDIGTSECVILEKWTQGKDANGNNTDTLVQRYTAYANIDNLSGSRVLESGQLKMSTSFDMIVRKKMLSANDVRVTWKVVYKGKRHTIKNKVCVNKINSDFLLTVDVK